MVSLLLHACLLHPNLPVFASKSAQDDNGVTADAAASEEEYDEDEELPYPKPGNGIRLPPEDDDIHILMDDDTEAFSHHWQGIAEMMSATGNALMGMNHTAMTVGAF